MLDGEPVRQGIDNRPFKKRRMLPVISVQHTDLHVHNLKRTAYLMDLNLYYGITERHLHVQLIDVRQYVKAHLQLLQLSGKDID